MGREEYGAKEGETKREKWIRFTFRKIIHEAELLKTVNCFDLQRKMNVITEWQRGVRENIS